MTTPVIEQSAPPVPVWRLTVEQYHRMIDAGILTADDPIELLEGWLVEKMVKKPRHSVATQYLRDLLAPLLPPGWIINVQEPVTTADSEPEPDIAVIQGKRHDYLERHPAPADVALVVEVSDTTLHQDRTLKLRIYARAGISVYWILNLQERQVEVYAEPEADKEGYRQQQIYRSDDAVPVLITGQEVGQLSVKSLLVSVD